MSYTYILQKLHGRLQKPAVRSAVNRTVRSSHVVRKPHGQLRIPHGQLRKPHSTLWGERVERGRREMEVRSWALELVGEPGRLNDCHSVSKCQKKIRVPTPRSAVQLYVRDHSAGVRPPIFNKCRWAVLFNSCSFHNSHDTPSHAIHHTTDAGDEGNKNHGVAFMVTITYRVV